MLKIFKDKFLFIVPNRKYTRLTTDSIMPTTLATLTIMVDYSELTHNIHLLILIPVLTYLWAYTHITITLLSNKEYFKDKVLKLKFIDSTIFLAIIFFIINMSIYILRAFYLHR